MSEKKLAQLAVLGGKPRFAEPIYVGRPNIGDRRRLHARLDEILDRNWLSNNGPVVQEFERRVAALTGVERCLAVCNGTIGLEIAIRAAGLRGEAIVPSFTFPATAHALDWLGLEPVFCDLTPGSHNLDPNMVEDLVGPRTSAIIGVHLWGIPCAVDELADIARRRRLRLMFDAAHAFGCSHRGRMIGGFGDAEVFSFHATKFLNSFEGGVIATDDGDLADRMDRMRNFGFRGADDVVSVGTNGKMTEVCAAMGLTSLEAMPSLVARNRANHERYRGELEGIPGIRLLSYQDAEKANYQYVVLEVDTARAGIARDSLLRVLQAENVQARRYFHPGCHRMEPYRSRATARPVLPHTERAAERVLVLPTGTAVGGEEIHAICALIRLAVEASEELRDRLEAAPGSGAGAAPPPAG